MTHHPLIKPRMAVLASDGEHVATVDRVEHRNAVRLAPDASGRHHWIPLDWVVRVDRHVHLDRTAEQVRRHWRDRPPAGNWTEAMFDERIPIRCR